MQELIRGITLVWTLVIIKNIMQEPEWTKPANELGRKEKDFRIDQMKI